MNTQMEKVSYIIGRQVASDIVRQGIELNADIFCDSFKSAVNGEESKLSTEEMKSIIDDFHTEMQQKAQEMAAKAAEVNSKEGQEFLEKNKTVDGVQVTASGLQYKVLREGNGATPTADSTVETHYEGKLINGQVFDSSYARGQTASFPVKGVIAGWTEALQLMKEGDMWELYIPASLAYGEHGAGAMIGPNATLQFKIELVSIK